MELHIKQMRNRSADKKQYELVKEYVVHKQQFIPEQ